jgi:hypothetical protein
MAIVKRMASSNIPFPDHALGTIKTDSGRHERKL